MPKIKSHHFKKTSKSGETIEFDSDVFVDSHGIFAVVFPEEYELEIRANLKDGCSVRKPRKYLRVESASLDAALASVEEGLLSLLNTEETHELVIRYKYVTQCHYAKNFKTGELYSNCGQGLDACGLSGQDRDIVDWVSNGAELGFQLYPVEPYTITIQAQVLRKTTYKSANDERIEYFRTSTPYKENEIYGDKPQLGEFGEKLNGFNHCALDKNEEEIPYTEPAAKFFHDAMLSLCALSENLSLFFNDKSNVISAIENQSGLLPFLKN